MRPRPQSSTPKPRKSSAARLPAGDPEFGRYLRDARKRAGLYQEQLAEKIGATKGLISQYEKGTTMPPGDALRKLGEVLKCGVDALLYGPSASRFRQASLPGFAIDERVQKLPEVMREFVMLALQRAEDATAHTPTQFMNPPTSENWAQFAAYLEAITMRNIRRENGET